MLDITSRNINRSVYLATYLLVNTKILAICFISQYVTCDYYSQFTDLISIIDYLCWETKYFKFYFPTDRGTLESVRSVISILSKSNLVQLIFFSGTHMGRKYIFEFELMGFSIVQRNASGKSMKPILEYLRLDFRRSIQLSPVWHRIFQVNCKAINIIKCSF